MKKLEPILLLFIIKYEKKWSTIILLKFSEYILAKNIH